MSNFTKNPLQVASTIEKIFGDDLHAMRVLSLANSVVGTVDAAVLSIHAIGRGYAHVTNKNEKHGVKQTDRMLGNAGIEVWQLFRPWAQFVVGERKEIVIALDWTEFDADDHATLAGYLITSHGRATPLIWMTVSKSTLKNKRNDHEYRLIERLHECLAADVKITLLADRGFGDQKLYQFLQTLGWDFVIRFRGVIQVEDAAGTRKPAKSWVPNSGRATMMRDARVTRTRAEVPAVVVVHAKDMEEAWCLVTSLAERTASEIVRLYGRRFTIEETFRACDAARVPNLRSPRRSAAKTSSFDSTWSSIMLFHHERKTPICNVLAPKRCSKLASTERTDSGFKLLPPASWLEGSW